MATAAPTTRPETEPAPAPSPTDHPYRMTIDRYYRLIRAGVFSPSDPVYLWKGQLVAKMTINPPHASTLTALNASMVRITPVGWHVRPEQPVELGTGSVPEPDLAIVRGASKDYSSRHPTAQDVAMLVEVSDSSLAEDQGDKLQSYAEAGIPVYWIVNLPGRRVEVHTDPTGPAGPSFYRKSQLFVAGDEVPIVLDGREVGRLAVSDILP